MSRCKILWRFLFTAFFDMVFNPKHMRHTMNCIARHTRHTKHARDTKHTRHQGQKDKHTHRG